MAYPLRPGQPGGLGRLDWLLTRYWDEAEADLAFRGISLRDLFQQCEVRLLLNLIESLPRDTLTRDAQANDIELVEALMSQRDPDEKKSTALRLSEYSPETEMLQAVYDRLGELITATYGAAGSKKPPRPRPLPRPETAWKRVQDKRQYEHHERVLRLALPNGYQPLDETG